eukprot:jgi/Ulvmu1/8829/UM049_0009.1
MGLAESTSLSAPAGAAVEPVSALSIPLTTASSILQENPPSAPAPGPGQQGGVRLVSRVDVNGYATGALQVFGEGALGAVCSSGFDNRDTLVACRQLGFRGVLVQPQSPDFQTSISEADLRAPFALGNLVCSGSETRLVDYPAAASEDSSDTDGART